MYGYGYLDHAASEIRDFLGSTGRILFVPYALRDRDAYAAKVRERLQRMACTIDSVHEASDPVRTVEESRAIFIGGGNTFRLLNALYESDLLSTIRRKASEGVPYIGSSAGTNVACPTIKTTNDMPIVQPPSFDALGLVPFQINPHYLDLDPAPKHMGETREERIRQFHEENELPVIGLREGAMLRIEGDSMILKGSAAARLFRRGQDPIELETGLRLDYLLK